MNELKLKFEMLKTLREWEWMFDDSEKREILISTLLWDLNYSTSESQLLNLCMSSEIWDFCIRKKKKQNEIIKLPPFPSQFRLKILTC